MATRDFKIQKLFPRVKFSTGENFALSPQKIFFKLPKFLPQIMFYGEFNRSQKNFCQTRSGNFSALFKKFAPQNLNLMGIMSSASLNKNQFFVKNEKIFRLLKILEKFYQSKNISQGKSK